MKVITLRIDPDEHARIKHAAWLVKKSMNEFIREAVASAVAEAEVQEHRKEFRP